MPTDKGERGHPARQRSRLGGARESDPPLTTRDCADWMGLTPEWIRGAIDEGVTVAGVTVKLRAESVVLNGRRINRIHLDAFVVFLTTIGWKRLPKRASSASRATATI